MDTTINCNWLVVVELPGLKIELNDSLVDLFNSLPSAVPYHTCRQIRRLLGLGSWTEQDVCEPPLALPQEKQRGKKRQWVSDTFQSFMGSVGGGSDSGPDAAVKVVAKASRGADRATAQELERLLGEVSSYEGRLDNLLDFSSSIPDRENSGSDGDGDGELQQDEDVAC